MFLMQVDEVMNILIENYPFAADLSWNKAALCLKLSNDVNKNRTKKNENRIEKTEKLKNKAKNGIAFVLKS